MQDVALHDIKLIDTSRVMASDRLHGHYGSEDAVICYRILFRFIKNSGHDIPIDWRDVETEEGEASE